MAAASNGKAAPSSSSSTRSSCDGHRHVRGHSQCAPFFQGGAPRVDGQALVVFIAQCRGHRGDGIGSFHVSPGRKTLCWGRRARDDRWTYPEDAGALVFEQRFLTDIGAAPAPSGGSAAYARTLFPAFSLSTSAAAQLPCASYHGVFPRLQTTTVSKYAASHQGGAPLIIWNASDDTLPMVTLSPLGQPKAQHFDSLDGFIGAGIKSTVQSIPAGHVQRFLMSAGTGISDGMLAWGDRLST